MSDGATEMVLSERPVIIGGATLYNMDEVRLLSRSQRYRLRKKGIQVPFVTRQLGYTQSPEHIKKRSEAKKNGKHFNCLVCGTEFWRSLAHIKKGDCKFCSKLCYQKSQVGVPKGEAFKIFCGERTGEKNPNWMGGITPDRMKIRSSAETRKWRVSVLERDKYKCQDCGVAGEKGSGLLHTHHLKPFFKFPELRFDIKNGVTLCRGCHYARHTKPENRTH